VFVLLRQSNLNLENIMGLLFELPLWPQDEVDEVKADPSQPSLNLEAEPEFEEVKMSGSRELTWEQVEVILDKEGVPEENRQRILETLFSEELPFNQEIDEEPAGLKFEIPYHPDDAAQVVEEEALCQDPDCPCHACPRVAVA
jgi:hypothetical protein